MKALTTWFLGVAMSIAALGSFSLLPAQSEGSKKPAATIEIEGYQPEKDLFLERNARFTVLIQGAEATGMRVVYRPTSKVEAVQDLGRIEGGKVEWTPSQSGLARLEAFVEVKDDEGEVVKNEDGSPKTEVLVSRVVSIKLGPGFPLGLVIMGLAGAILFFGAFASIRALLRA